MQKIAFRLGKWWKIHLPAQARMAEAQNSNYKANEGDKLRLGLYKIKIQRWHRLKHSEDAYGVIDEDMYHGCRRAPRSQGGLAAGPRGGLARLRRKLLIHNVESCRSQSAGRGFGLTARRARINIAYRRSYLHSSCRERHGQIPRRDGRKRASVWYSTYMTFLARFETVYRSSS